MSGTAVRVGAVAMSITSALSATLLVGVVRDRSALPVAAEHLLAATVAASEVTTCLQGVQDEIYVPGVARLRTGTSMKAARDRLATCDVAPLVQALDAVHLPPAPAVTTAKRRTARADIDTAVSTLRRVVRDARGAAIAMAVDVRSGNDGTAVALAYRSAAQGSDDAYQLALTALDLLGRPQTSVG